MVRILGLDPVARPTQFVARAAALRHDPLEAELACVLKHCVARLVEVLAELQAGLGLDQQPGQCGLTILDRLAP